MGISFVNTALSGNQQPSKSPSRSLKWLLIFVGIFTLIISWSLYYVLNSDARQALIKQMLLREESVSKAGAQSITSFIKLFGNSLVLLANNQEVISRGENTQEALDDFVQIWKETPLNGVLFVDKDGKALLLSTKTGGAIPKEIVSVADRDYFTWGKQAKKREVFIGQPIFPIVGNLGNQYIIPVATPVYKNGDFDGLLIASILLSGLTKEYLNPLKISQDASIYLISSTGTILYGPSEKLIGKNYIEYLDEYSFLGSGTITDFLKKKAESTREGTMDIVLPDEQKGGLTRFLIAYTPIFYDHNHLFLAIVIPAKVALAYIAPIYINQLSFLIAGFLAILLLTIVCIRFGNNRRRKK